MAEEEAIVTTNSVDEEMALPSQSPAEPSVESSNPSLLSEAPKRSRQDDNEGDVEEDEELRKKKQKVDVCTPLSSDALPAETLNGHAHEIEVQKESEKEEDETAKEEVKEEKEEGHGVAAMDGESEVEAKEASPSSPPPPPTAAAEEEVKGEEEEEEEEKSSISKPSEVTLGPKTFRSPSQLFHFVSELLHAWPLNFNVNKYECLVMTDLIQKGYPDPMAKIGAGIETFQVRMNPVYDSRCFYVMRKDGSMEDFSFRKCVDSLMGLPDDLRHHNGRNQHHGGKGGGKNQGHNKSGGKGRHGRGFNGRGHGRGHGGYRRG